MRINKILHYILNADLIVINEEIRKYTNTNYLGLHLNPIKFAKQGSPIEQGIPNHKFKTFEASSRNPLITHRWVNCVLFFQARKRQAVIVIKSN